ncbi:MAG: TlpA disulfide reductase family protein, partial [Cyclobacteriaceae bacterium]
QEVQPMLGQMAPAFTLNDLNGKIYSIDQFKGRYVVIHFAATWCPFCNAEAPNLEQLYKDYRDRGVEVFIVDVKEGKEVVERSFSRFNFSFPVLLDADGKVSASYAPAGVQPSLERHEVPIAANLIIDKEGKISYYSLLNTTSFDAKLTNLRQTLDDLINAGE